MFSQPKDQAYAPLSLTYNISSLRQIDVVYVGFSVNGSDIPEVDWDIGESYAGLLSTTDDPDYEQQLFFWFFPAKNQLPQNEILLWLNGGVI